MTKLRLDAEKSPLIHVLIVFALGVGLLSFPTYKLFELMNLSEFWAFNLGGAIYRILIGLLAIFFIIKYGFHKVLSNKIAIKSIVIILPIILVVINNFPIVGLISGRVVLSRNIGENLVYILYCLSVGFAEEMIFVGLIFPLLTIYFKDKKGSFLLPIIFSAGLFGFSHLINLFGGASLPSTLLQVGYSFLIGGACVISLAVAKNLFVAVVIHFIYDFGGLILSPNGIAKGSQWDILTVVITAVLGVITLIYAVIICIKIEKNKAFSLYDIK